MIAAALWFAGLIGAADFPVTDHGAIGDGTTLNTAAIQTSIDAAAAAGGGRVVIPAGTFRSGSLFLKPGVELHVAEGGVLLGSRDIADYPKRETRIEGHFEPWRMALLNAEEIPGVRLTGAGTIDGDGEVFWAAFWQRRKENPKCTNLEVERPRLLFIDRCTDVRIEGLRLRDSGFWNVHLYRCRDVVIDGLDFQSPSEGRALKAPSTDGIDVDSCQRVTVRRCSFAVDDDCIALKGSKGPHADRDASSPPVEDILVEGCTFRAGAGVLTCGSEATVVRRVVVRDCEVVGNVNVVRLKLRPDTPQLYEDLRFENIRLEGEGRVFEVAPWRQFFDLKGEAPPSRRVRGVVVKNLTGRYGTLGRITGNPGDALEDLRFEASNLTLRSAALQLAPSVDLRATDVTINGAPWSVPSAP